MSLNSLPDEIIAKISKKMPHCDRLNLMATNQKQAKIGQNYRLHYKYGKVSKLQRAYRLRMESSITENHLSVYMSPLWPYDCNMRRLTTTVDKLPSILREMWSIEEFAISSSLITADLINVIVKHKSKIDTFLLKECSLQTKTDFENLTDGFKKLRIWEFSFPIPREQITETEDIFTEEYILSEETLHKVLPRSSSFCFMDFNTDGSSLNGINLTDRFLHEIVLKCWPLDLTLEACQTSFTLPGILNFIKLAEAKCSLKDYCDFGSFFVENKQQALLKIAEFEREFNYELVINEDKYSEIEYTSGFSKVEIRIPPYNEDKDCPTYSFTILYNIELLASLVWK